MIQLSLDKNCATQNKDNCSFPRFVGDSHLSLMQACGLPVLDAENQLFLGLLVMDKWGDGSTTSWQRPHAVITRFPPLHTRPLPCPAYTRCVCLAAFMKRYEDSLRVQPWLGQSPWLLSVVDGKLCSVVQPHMSPSSPDRHFGKK